LYSMCRPGHTDRDRATIATLSNKTSTCNLDSDQLYVALLSQYLLLSSSPRLPLQAIIMFSSNAVRFVLVLATAFNAVASAQSEAVVNLGTAANYAILTSTGISTVPSSAITGDIAVSPISRAAMTGFSFTLGAGGELSESVQVTGTSFSADSVQPGVQANLTTAVSDMETAYTDAAGRNNADAARINLGAGLLGGVFGGPTDPLTAGVYTFGSDVSINSDIVFSGDSDAVFIIQMTGNLKQSADVTLTGGAQAKNIFWQVAGLVEVTAGKHLEGILLVKTAVTFKTGSSLNGRVLAQTRCNLQQAIINSF
jgi:hypothetical protein